MTRSGAQPVHSVSATLDRLAGAAEELLGRRVEAVERLSGGEHALTIEVRAGGDKFIVRLFPRGDSAVEHEVGVLDRLTPLGSLAPRLISYETESELGPIIITTKVRGGHPAPTLPAKIIAEQLAGALAKIHRLSGNGLREVPWTGTDQAERVLTHYDFWCGNALWDQECLTGVIDWSGARSGPRAVDLAWCRLDLVLLGSPDAADHFLDCYQRFAEVTITDIQAWDLLAADQATDAVESWAPNYLGIGRGGLTPNLLRARFDAWVAGQE